MSAAAVIIALSVALTAALVALAAAVAVTVWAIRMAGALLDLAEEVNDGDRPRIE